MPNIDKIIERINSKPYNSNIKFNELQAYYEYFGFRIVRIKGSHHTFRNQDGIIAEVPSHGNEVLACYVKQAHDLIQTMEAENEKEKKQ